MRIDLHLHSNCSDGMYAPEEVLRRVQAADLGMISITDHDSCSAYEQVKKSSDNGVRIIRGVELSSTYENNEIHIMGYFRDGINGALERFLTDAQANRRRRIALGIENLLKKYGMELSYEELIQISQPESIGRNHLARLMLKQGYVNSIAEAFRVYLNYNFEVVPQIETQVKTVIDIIRASGGITVWAHPPFGLFDKYLTVFMDLGLQGVEAYNQRKSSKNTFYYHTVAEKFGLMISAGSDWHGFQNETFLSEANCPPEVVENFINHFN